MVSESSRNDMGADKAMVKLPSAAIVPVPTASKLEGPLYCPIIMVLPVPCVQPSSLPDMLVTAVPPPGPGVVSSSEQPEMNKKVREKVKRMNNFFMMNSENVVIEISIIYQIYRGNLPK